MDLSVSKFRAARAFMAMLSLTMGAGALHAANLLNPTASVSVSCSTITGPGTAASITVKPVTSLTGTNTIAVTFTAPGSGLTVTPPATTTLSTSNQSAGIVFTVNTSSGCAGATSGMVALQFKAASNSGTAANDATTTITDTVTTTLLTATSSVSVSCSTATGTGAPASITVKPVTALTGSNNIAVTFVTPGMGLTVTAPMTATLSTANQAAGIVFTVNNVANCVGASSQTVTLVFEASLNSASPVMDAATMVTDTVAATTSGLTVTPATLTVLCTLVSSTYTPAAPQTVSVTSAAAGGTPYTLDTSSGNDPAWLTISPSAPSGTAGSTAAIFTVAAASGCGGFALNSTHTVNLHLQNTPAPDKLIPVALQIVPASPLTVTPVPAAPKISLSYVKGSGSTASVNVSVTSSVPSVYVAINTASLPSWLTVDNTSGTAPWALRFSTTSVADSLAPGTYSATVYFQVSGYAALGVPISLQVNNKAPTLSVNATQVNLTWTLGTAIPTATVVATSSDSPIQYTITSGGTLQPSVSAAQQSGKFAYNFGTDIGVTFNSLAFASASPGSVLTGTVTLTWGSPASTTVVTFLVTVDSPGATLSGITPASLPTAAPGTRFTLNMSGTGFVGGSNAALATRVGVVVSNSIVTDTNLSISVVNPSNITLTIVVPTAGSDNILFASGGSLLLGIVNGNSSNIPTGTAQITIGAGPIIQGATSASAFTEVTPPNLPTFAPYDIVSLFGANFCPSCGSTQILENSPDALTLRFPATLSPDANAHLLTVSFYVHAGAFIANAPLLFATNGQINLVVPAGVAADAGAEAVDIVAYFGSGTIPASIGAIAGEPSTLLSSTPFPVNIAGSDPGIFTVGSDGQGSGAVLSATWALITGTNPAGMRSMGTDSDTVQIFVTGLGAPDSAADNTMTGSSTLPTDCIGATPGMASNPGSYMATLQSATGVSPMLANIDGAVIQSALLNSGRYPPCFVTNPTVTIGGVAATVSYAGFVADSIAGLYQINAQLPSTTGTFYPNYPLMSSPITNVTAPVQLPVQVTVGSGMSAVSSQPGVTVWVAPSLLVTGPTGSGLNAQVNVTWSGTVTATEGTGSILYSLSSGLLPTGLTLDATTGIISGRPAAGTAGSYTVTIAATDSATTPVTGSVTFTIVVAGGLYTTSSVAGPFDFTYGATGATLTTITATGGAYPYSYTLSFAGSGTPSGLSIGLHTGAVTTTNALPAGTYHVTVTATDSAGTPLTGAANFDIVVALNVSEAAGSGSTLAVITTTGSTGTLTYALDNASTTAGLMISGGNLTAGGASSGTYPVTVTVTDSVTMAPGASAFGTGTVGPFSVTF